jgi:RNA polymerase sigma-70 factor, ECF subfamily
VEKAVIPHDIADQPAGAETRSPELAHRDEEQRLLRLAQDGDLEAFNDLYARLSPVLLRFIQRIVGYGQESEDVLQDSFVSLFVKLPAIDPERLRPYAFRIARNGCYDLLRREGRTGALALDAESDFVSAPLELADRHALAPDDAAHWVLLNLEVQDALDRLPASQRQTLALYTEAELSYPEIADVMGISIGTVRSRLFHARKNLRGLLRPETLLAIYDEFGNQTDSD